MTRELLKQSLDALEPIAYEGTDGDSHRVRLLRDAIRAELAKPEWPEPSGKVLTMADSIADLEGTARPGAEPVAWMHDCAALCTNDVKLWIDACPHCGKPRIAATVPQAQPAAQAPAVPNDEPVARVIDSETALGDIEWLPRQGHPLQRGDLLYTAPQAQSAAPAPVVREPLTDDRVAMLEDALRIVRQYPDFDGGGPMVDMIDNALAGKSHPMLEIMAKVDGITGGSK